MMEQHFVQTTPNATTGQWLTPTSARDQNIAELARALMLDNWIPRTGYGVDDNDLPEDHAAVLSKEVIDAATTFYAELDLAQAAPEPEVEPVVGNDRAVALVQNMLDQMGPEDPWYDDVQDCIVPEELR